MPLLYDTIQYQREECLEITGFEGTVKSLTIPDRIDGLYVRSIAKHAFARRTDLVEVSLPDSIKRLSLFAFHNCANLKKLTLYDSVEDYYDGVIRQCGELEWIELYGSARPYALMREMLEDNDHAMSFRLHLPGEEICLSFPSYALIASENTMARTIQFAYEGGGYAYRNCVHKKEIRYREYDRLFSFMEHDDPSFAAIIATDRLLYPHDLDEAAQTQYTGFLRGHAKEALDLFIRRRQIDRVRMITEQGLADENAIVAALRTASDLKETAICALLMESGRHNKKQTTDLSLELEDW